MRLTLKHPLGDEAVRGHYEAALAVRGEDDPPSPAPDWGRDRIFVSIAAFRDSECHKTIENLFAMAARPERIHIGLVWQLDPVEDAAYLEPALSRPGQVRELRFDWRESRNVCWARFLAQALWRGEDYFLQIDSHMRFEQGWDETLVADLEGAPHRRCILASSPPPYLTPGDVLAELHSGVLRTDGFDAEGGLRVTGVWLNESLDRYLRMPFLLAGGFAARAELIQDVPYDPYGCFATEEISYCIRTFTHGWDIFSAPRRWFWHQYRRDNRIKRGVTNDARFEAMQGALTWRAFLRFNHVTRFGRAEDASALLDLDLFGLGDERSLTEYEAFAGVDFRFKRVAERACRAQFIPDIASIAKIVVPVLDDDKERRPALVDHEELLLREALSSWPVEDLARETVELFEQIEQMRAERAGQARPALDRERLVRDFSSWKPEILAADLAKLVWAVRAMSGDAALEPAG